MYAASPQPERRPGHAEGAYPVAALPTVSASSYAASPYGYGSAGGGINGGGASSANGRLAPTTLGLRKRDAIAIFTCLFLLRLAFNPSNTAASNGLIDFSDSSIGASMELAFYAPFQSHPPGYKGKNARTARPVPLDVDGDGVVEAVVVPVFMKRGEVAQERELEVEEAKKRKKSFAQRKALESKTEDSAMEGWADEGSWGLRVLNLKPLHRRETEDGEGISLAGPFAPRTLFLSPLVPYATKPSDASSGDEHAEMNQRGTSPDTYPIKLLPLQIPIQHVRLGEEEKSRQRHKKETSGAGGYGKKSDIPAKDDPLHSNYDRTRHYFCGKDWHHAAASCHKHCPGGLSTECGEGETCYADTPCDVHIEPGDSSASADAAAPGDEFETKMALTKLGTLPGFATVWSDGSVSMHVVTADIAPAVGSDGHRTKRAKQKAKKPELELRQLWRVFPLQSTSDGPSNVDFEELGIAFESGAIYGGASPSSPDTKEGKRYGDNGAIILGGRYYSENQPLKVSFHALDAMTGTSLWDLKGNKDSDDKSKSNEPPIPIIHTTSSARRRSHLPTTDMLDPDLDNENAFIEGDDIMTSEECMSHFRASVLDDESGALPHEFWDDGEFGSINVGRFDRGKRAGGKRKSLGKKGRHILNKKKGGPGGTAKGAGTAGSGGNIGQGGRSVGGKGGSGHDRRGGAKGGRSSWQSDLLSRAVPRRLIKQQRYKSRHPHMGKPNVVLFHGREGLAVLSLKNGRPVCHISLMDHSLYADMDGDGVVDIVQVVTSPETFQKSNGVQSLIQRVAKEASEWRSQPDSPVICHALVTSGLPPREEVFTAPLCVGGPVNPGRPQHLSAAAPLLLEGSLGFGNDVVFAMNSGVVVRYDFNGREVWRKRGGLKDGTPTWDSGGRSAPSSASAFLGRIQFGSVRESHTSVSASSHRNQHRPGSPVRPILLSGEDGAALISPANGKVLSAVTYPQRVASHPLLADLTGDGTDDLLVVSDDGIWGYRVVVETGRSGGFTIVVVTLLIGVALAALVHKTSHQPGQTPKRSTDA
ncbi:hypothetical protein ACHAXT_002556 [Thalassiosira profunda]